MRTDGRDEADRGLDAIDPLEPSRHTPRPRRIRSHRKRDNARSSSARRPARTAPRDDPLIHVIFRDAIGRARAHEARGKLVHVRLAEVNTALSENCGYCRTGSNWDSLVGGAACGSRLASNVDVVLGCEKVAPEQTPAQ